ncbi:MAG: carboxylating nicotinate-nucleotide diphosphorylase [Clostridium sp.]|nr:carboxylating nicotinate-nucleotide diphosphorylase [Clostridium sp.]
MINGVTMKINVDQYIWNTLKEDITSEDVSTNAVMPQDKQGKAELICKQDGIICGLDIFKRTFELLDETSRFEANFKDGDEVKSGDLLGVIYGDIKAILSGERTGLNYLQRMSGIATITREYMKELEGTSTTLLDTRKTTPNMRPFEKYAVTVGGATNHRYNLSDGVLLKDNHIGAAGSITKAIQMAKAYAPFVRKIEIETETLEQVQEAVEAGADIIMLDNMDNETMRRAVELIAGRAETECSGNVTKERLKSIADVGVDFVSCGALTHSAPIMDVSLKNLTPIE